MKIRCVGCGEALGGGTAACPKCGSPAEGASFEEAFVLSGFGRARAPKACCCCLGEPCVVDGESVSARGIVFELEVPWCSQCRGRRRAGTWAAVVAGAVGLGLFFAWLMAVRPDLGFGLGWLVAGLMTLVPGGLAAAALPHLLPSFRRRGHVAGCAAYGGGQVLLAPDTGKVFGRVVFRNRAFAREYERLNGR